MRKLFLLPFLLSIFAPTICFADMVGYSGDMRRYVTDAEKKQFPYNTVVRFEYWDDDGGITGTGTFISNDLLLTCRHVVEKPGEDKRTNFYTSDGKQNWGTVVPYISATEGDFGVTDAAFVFHKNAFSGPVLKLAETTRMSNNVMIIGYDSLKPLSKSELKIVRQLYTNWIKAHGKIDKNNSYMATKDIERELKTNYSCSLNNTKNCVKCSNYDGYCIFGDHENMKIRTGCQITDIKTVKKGHKLMFTNCPGSGGASGSAIVDVDTKEIIGIFCRNVTAQIGQRKDATNLGVSIDFPYKTLHHQNDRYLKLLEKWGEDK